MFSRSYSFTLKLCALLVLPVLIAAVALLWPVAEPASATGDPDAIVSAGDSHTCALTTAGGVKCWGINSNGQLGDGTKTQRNTPVDVTGLASGVAAVSAGGFHTCALTTAGGVKCWGLNSSGQLGDGTKTQRNTPVDVSGLTSGVAAVSAGQLHTCALTTAGGVKCWGRNTDGQLGDGTKTQRNTPVDVTGLTSGVAAVSAGGAHTCAPTTAGGLKCWGFNASGQLGDGTKTQRNTPVGVTGLASGVAAVSGGRFHTCALATAGGVKCWGLNSSGQLGDGTKTQRNTPVDVSGLTSGVAAVSAGDRHTCALTTAGGLKCWGRNTNGQLGDGTKTQRNTPVDVTGLTSAVAAVSAGTAFGGSSHTCALTTAGGVKVKCWGQNGNGQLGDGTKTQRNTPVDVLSLAAKPPPTPTPTPTPTVTPTPTKQPFKGDTDGDGCPDVNENLPKAQMANGGGRDYKNPWDWYDVDQNGSIDLFIDILGVIQHYSLDGSPPYNVIFDRGASAGPNTWNMTAPDGSIDLFVDILGVIKQYSLEGCTVDPGA